MEYKDTIEWQGQCCGYLIEVNIHPYSGHRSGYVYLPKDHRFYEIDYDEIPVNVHGGLTFGRNNSGYWKIGFDCGHLGDGVDWDTVLEFYKGNKEVTTKLLFKKNGWETCEVKKIRTLEFCIEQLTSLCKQLYKENGDDKGAS